MRIVFIELTPSGGLFQFSYQLADHLAEQGQEVELLTGPHPELVSSRPGFVVKSVLPTWHNGPQRVHSLAWHRARRGVRGVRHIAALARVLLYIVARRPDVVFWHPLRFSIDSWCVLAASRLTSSAMTTVLHEPRPLSEQPGRQGLYRAGPLLHGSLAAAVRRMDAIFVLSERVASYVRQSWNPPGVVEVIPHGDEGVFLTEGHVRRVETTPPDVLFFGTWTQHKGIDVLLTAFDRVRKRVPDARLTMAGALGNVDLDEIRLRARQVGNVSVLPGYVPMSSVAELMGAHRLVVLPYVRANQSGVAHLAQTFGRPVVATRVGDIPEVVVNDQTGLLVEPGDAEALADALIRLLESPQEAARMGGEAARSVGSSGSWRGIADIVSATLKGIG
jgi:glycosyltransferase involved in cell wall biosynthesis